MKVELVLTVFLLSGALAQPDQPLCGAKLLDASKPVCPRGHAPGDFVDDSCFEGRNAVHHDFFSDDVKILMDNYAHKSLYGSRSGIWLSRDFGGAGTWSPDFGGVCTNLLRTCTFSRPNQNNWLFSQFVCLQDAKELLFNVTFKFSQCSDNPACDDAYVTLYRYCVDRPVSNEQRTNRDNYVPLNGTMEDSRLQQPQGFRKRVNDQRSLLRPSPTTAGCYFAVQDQGTCGQVERCIISSGVCPAKQKGLVLYPEFAVPPKAGPDEKFQAVCVCNAHNVTNLTVLASAADGTCVDEVEGGARCECDDGYIESTDGSECIPCRVGTYKAASVGDTCLPCPANTTGDSIGAAQCECLPGHYRSDSEGPEFPCTVPPEQVTADDLDLVEGSETATNATIKWPFPADTGRTDTVFSICAMNLTDLTENCYDVVPAPETDELGFARHVLKHLVPFSTYVVTLTVRNGVSNQQDQPIIPATVHVFTTEGVPNEPFLKNLCTVVIWKPPTEPQGQIASYDLCFGCGVGETEECFPYQASDNFHVTSKQQQSQDVGVKIRANNSISTGPFTPCVPIGCADFKSECPSQSEDTSPTPEPLEVIPPLMVTNPPAAPATTPEPLKVTPPPMATDPPAAPATTPEPLKVTPPPMATDPPAAPATTPEPLKVTPLPMATDPPAAPATTPEPLKVTPLPMATDPPAAPTPCDEAAVEPIYFTVGKTGDRVEAGSTLSIADIGETNEALLCHTPYEQCCQKERVGEFRNPNGEVVPVKKNRGDNGAYRNRGKGYIRLNIPADTENVIIGEYQCCIPNGCGNMKCVPVTLTN